jgi:beta-1,4-N-acetylglucosaminyltransferase
MLDTPRTRARIPLVFLQELDSPTRSTISLTLSMFRLCSCVCCLLAALWFSFRSSFHFAPSCIAACCVIWLWRITCTPAYAKSSSGGCNVPVRALVVLGSGGHTAEMMTMMRSLVQQNMQFSSVLYALAATDSMSRFKAENSGIKGEFAVVPRAREVGQSYATSALTTARAFVYSCLCVMRYRPQLLLCNGPGTCVPFAIAASMCRCVHPPHTRRRPHTRRPQVLRTFPLLHSVRGVVCTGEVAVHVGAHHVSRGR